MARDGWEKLLAWERPSRFSRKVCIELMQSRCVSSAAPTAGARTIASPSTFLHAAHPAQPFKRTPCPLQVPDNKGKTSRDLKWCVQRPTVNGSSWCGIWINLATWASLPWFNHTGALCHKLMKYHFLCPHIYQCCEWLLQLFIVRKCVWGH